MNPSPLTTRLNNYFQQDSQYSLLLSQLGALEYIHDNIPHIGKGEYNPRIGELEQAIQYKGLEIANHIERVQRWRN